MSLATSRTRVTDALPALALGRIHVWSASLDQPLLAADLPTCLSGDERQRASRYLFERDAVRFTVGRIVLRQILGAYVDADPASLRFAYGPYGKPRLAWPNVSLFFNVAHSDGLALYVVGREPHLGIDVERHRPLADLEQLAERCFAASELAVLRALPVERRHKAFFDCWTRKEAFIKALGSGLSHPLETFVVSLGPGRPARLEHVAGDPTAARRWSLHGLPVSTGYTAALAVEDIVPPPACWPWEGNA